MTHHTRVVLSLLLVLAAPLECQVPEGWHILSAVANPESSGPWAGGILLVHPRSTNDFQLVTGLGADLTGAGVVPPGAVGTGCVLYHESDGRLVAGERAAYGQSLDIHRIGLVGCLVATDLRYPVGTVVHTEGSGIDQMAWVSESQVVFCLRNGVAGPMAGYAAGVLDLASGAITPILAAGVQPGPITSLAVAPGPTAIYVGRSALVPGGVGSQVYRIPYPACAPSHLLATLPRTVRQLAVDSTGRLFAGLGNVGPAADLVEIDIPTGAVTVLHPTFSSVDSLGIEAVTGFLSFTAVDPACSNFRGHYVGPPGGPYVQIVNQAIEPVLTLPLLVNSLTGCCVNSNMDRYGTPSGGPNVHTIDIAPNPDGLAITGNEGFGVTVRSTPGTFPGVLGIALQASSVPILGVTVLVDIPSLLLTIDLPAAATHTIPLGLPEGSNLGGNAFYLQTVHFESGGLASSAGLRILVL